MNRMLNPAAPTEFRLAGLCIAAAVCIVGAVVLCGWAMRIITLESVLPGLATMKANTALCFVLSGLAVGSMTFARQRRWMQTVGLAAAALSLTISGISLMEGLLHWRAGIDELLFTDVGNTSASPGRMSSGTAICFMLVAISVLVMHLRKPAAAAAGQLLALATGSISYLALLGYVYGVESLYKIGVYSSMALHTAACFALLAVALLCVRAQWAFMSPVSSPNAGGWMARRFILAILLLPLALGLLRWTGERMGYYDARFGLMLVLIGLVIGFILMTWLNGRFLNKADEHQQRLNQTQRDILTAIPAGIALLDEHNVILSINESWKRFITDNRVADKVFCIGLDYLALCRQGLVPDAEAVAGAIETVHRDNKPFTMEYTRQVDHKQRWYHLTITPLDHSNRGTVVLHYDLTERKLLEEQLAQSQKMESIGKLAGGVAHDFNNMLTIITGYAELAADALKPDDPAAESLKEIQATCERAASLSRQLLSFARKQMISPRATDLNELVGNVEKMIRRVIGENVQVKVARDDELWPVHVDPGQIEQVLINLAINARDAMPRGGTLSLQTENVTLDETYSRQHTTIAPGQYVMLLVSDTGTGMTPEVKKRAFEPFFTTKGPGKGTGLGLATCYGIVKQAGGDIWVYSEINRGTTFKIYLPRLQEIGEQAEAATTSDEVMGGNETILLVEDDAAVRAITRQTLQRLGYTVLEAGGGAEAFTMARQHPGRIDLLLTDMIMPQYSGRQVAKAIREMRPNIPVLFMSGYTDDTIIRNGVEDRSMLLLQKPFTAKLLSQKVREALAQDANRSKASANQHEAA